MSLWRNFLAYISDSLSTDTNNNPLIGRWRLDRDATAKYLLENLGLPAASVEKLYAAQENIGWTIDDSRCYITTNNEEKSQEYRIEDRRGRKMTILFLADDKIPSSTSTIELEKNGLAYWQDGPHGYRERIVRVN